MSTHDKIDLPPPAGHYYEWDGVYGKRKFTAAPHNGRECDRAVAYYTADQVRAAIEADRKRRGEPVAWIQRTYLNLIRESNVALHNVVVRGSILDGDGDVVPLFTAPQPAEPVAESERVYLHDEGYPEYLDGAQCQYVIERGKPYPHGDPVAFVYEKEDAERIVAALNNEPRRGEPVDKGPWKAGVNRSDKRTFIQSDDFTHDVRLYVDGDFADQDEKLAYALGIADQLNAAPQPAETGREVEK